MITGSTENTKIKHIDKPWGYERLLEVNKELDFSFGFGGGTYGDLGRFRTNVYYQRGVISAAFRYLQPKIKTLPNASQHSRWSPHIYHFSHTPPRVGSHALFHPISKS